MASLAVCYFDKLGCFASFDKFDDFDDFAFSKGHVFPEKPKKGLVCWFDQFASLLGEACLVVLPILPVLTILLF